jgi:hypothetical protein
MQLPVLLRPPGTIHSDLVLGQELLMKPGGQDVQDLDRVTLLLDDECLLAGFRVPRQGAVGEAQAGRLGDDVHDTARCADPRGQHRISPLARGPPRGP